MYFFAVKIMYLQICALVNFAQLFSKKCIEKSCEMSNSILCFYYYNTFLNQFRFIYTKIYFIKY